MRKRRAVVLSCAIIAAVLATNVAPAAAYWFESGGETCTDWFARRHNNRTKAGYTHQSLIGWDYQTSATNSPAISIRYFSSSQGYGGYAFHRRGATGNFDLYGSYGYCSP